MQPISVNYTVSWPTTDLLTIITFICGHKNITRFYSVGEKRNKFSPISQYSNQNEEQLLNIDIEHIRQF